jgi:hypothetical protein
MLRKQVPPQAGLSLRQFPAIQIKFDKTLLTANSRRSARADRWRYTTSARISLHSSNTRNAGTAIARSARDFQIRPVKPS